MSLRDLMLADLERGLGISPRRPQLIPAWRILTPDGDFLILTRFDPDHPDQRQRCRPRAPLHDVEAGNGLRPDGGNLARTTTRPLGRRAVLTIGVSHDERWV